jgi:CheY-like chemotaxis protein
MSTRTLDEKNLAHAVEAMARTARSQAKIIDDLMDISRIITGKLLLDVHTVDLVPVIEAAVDAVSLAADAKSIRFQTRLDPQAGPVSGDPNRLQQIIWNLLFNAIKFTPKQGRVEIGLKWAESQLLPYIFDRFHQADSTSARKHGGLGLGLSIVRQLMEMHGGSVHADSPGEGQGATFTVALPLMAARVEAGDLYSIHPADLGEMLLSSAPALDGLRVLVVDDEADAREIFRLMLTGCGAEVRMSATAAEALESLEQWRPDVLVSDIGMAGEDDYELMRKVRAMEAERGGQTPAVALIGYANVEDQKRALAAGYNIHLPKPVALIELATAVAVLAGRD